MITTINDVIERFKDKKEFSLSMIQREMPIGFVQATKLIKELEDNQFIIKKENNKYVFNKKKIKDELGIEFRPSIKLIFLDVDGVLNCSTTKEKCVVYTGIEEKKVAILKQIVDETNAKIILISTWRYAWYKLPQLKSQQDELADYLDQKLSAQGLAIFDKIDNEAIGRGKGILDYLNRLKLKDIDIDSFIVIDDEISDYKSTRLMSHLIQTGYKDGLLNKHLRKSIKILNAY